MTSFPPIILEWRNDVPEAAETLAFVVVGEGETPDDIVQGMWFGSDEGWMTRADAGLSDAEWEPIDPGHVMGWAHWRSPMSLDPRRKAISPN